MSVKKRIVRAKTPSGLVLALALQALKHDAVQSRLREAPEAAVKWAQKRRHDRMIRERYGDVIDVQEAPVRATYDSATSPSTPGDDGSRDASASVPELETGSSTRPAIPVRRLGRRRLDRRLVQLETGFDRAFDGHEQVPAEVRAALEDLHRAIHATGGLPLAKRATTQLRINGELDRLEDALVEVVLPR